jgi:hypothetical protein
MVVLCYEFIYYELELCNKEAKGSNDEYLGEVGQNYILVQRGMINKEKFYIPIDMAERL